VRHKEVEGEKGTDRRREGTETQGEGGERGTNRRGEKATNTRGERD